MICYIVAILGGKIQQGRETEGVIVFAILDRLQIYRASRERLSTKMAFEQRL